jgi:hypothetical protein
VKAGLANYIAGSIPLFMFLKCAWRMTERPFLVGGCGLLVGFVKGHVRKIPQVEDKALIAFFRKQQMNRLLFRRGLWD